MCGKKRRYKLSTRLCIPIFVVIVLLISILSHPVYAQGESSRVLKVGRFPYAGQMMTEADGNRSGYGYDYLQEIARYTGWKYEYVDASWNDCLAMLERGEIDLMGAVMRSPEREDSFGFSEYPMISGYGVLATLLDNEALPYEDFSAFDGLEIGVLKGNLHREGFLEYSKLHGFTPVLREYDTQEDMDEALNAGEISAVIMANVLRSDTIRVIATFGENDAYFATTKGNDRVLEPLNEAMRQIRLADPYFNSKLDKKYYDLQATTVVSFTQEEQNFIKNSPPISCVYIPEGPPISYYNHASEEADGIAIEVCKLLEKNTGLRFEWNNPKSAKEAVDMLHSGEALVIPGKYHDFNWAGKNGVTMTEPYLPGQMIMITNRQKADSQVVALYDQGSQSQVVAKAISGEAKIKQYDTIMECMDAVIKGEANTTFVNATVASHLLNDPKYSMLQSNPVYGYSADLAMAVSQHANPLLVTVLNKGLRNISSTEINEILLSQINSRQAGVVADFLYLHPVETVMLLSLVFLALAITLFGLLRSGKRYSKKLHKMLYTDTLTGYPNYQALSLDAGKLLGQNPNQYALIYLDIHRFKVINDTFGYEVGDQVLIATSDLLQKFVKPKERFARLYADTFLLLLRATTSDNLRSRVDILSDQLSDLKFDNMDTLRPIFCGGVFPLQEEFQGLDKACDRANYAKDSISHPFSNTFVFYDDVIRQRILAEKELESSMSTALERGEFIPFYQPKVNAITGKVIGAEALVRWQHPEKGCLPPGEFLPFYEKNGFIVNIDLAIFEQVCKDLQSWRQTGGEIIPISVNFSRRNIRDKELMQKLKTIIDRHQVSPHLLEIELTETEELENMEIAIGFVNALKEMGFSVSIDDYGTGYSSISFLQELPLDTLKLDRKFILNAMGSDKARDIMRYLVSSMQKNDIRIMCEGIETEEQREFVIGLNCRYIQGYLYSKPLSKPDFEKYMHIHGTEVTDHRDFIPITNFNKVRWNGINDFLSKAMPSWVICSLPEPGYPIQYVSPNFLESMGYSELEFEVETKWLYINWVHPDDLSRALQYLEQKEEERGDFTQQHRLRKKDGSYIWIREINKRVMGENGQEVFISICTDISDLVALQTERNQLIETIPGGVGTLLLTDRGPIIQQSTDHFYDVIGYTKDEMVSLDNNLCSIIYQKDLHEAMGMLQQLLETDKQVCECIFRIKHKDDSLHWVSFRGTISRMQGQTYATVIVYNSDEDMQEKQKADITKAKLELALTLTEHAVFEYDIATRTIYGHSGFSNYGVADGAPISFLEDIMGKDTIHPDDMETIKSVQMQMMEGVHHVSYELRIKGDIGASPHSYIWVRVTLTTIFNEDNQPVRAVGIVEDISKQKHFEQAFQQESRYRKAFTESSLMAYEFNLTQNTIGRITGSRGFRLKELCDALPHPNNYAEVLRVASQVLVVKEDQEIFLYMSSVDHLLKIYHEGINENEVEYRRITPDGSVFWNSVLMYMLLDPLSGDIMGYAYHRDINERKETEMEWREQASKDPLTGIYNRSTAEELMQECLAQRNDENHLQAFLMFDADRFKEINDTYGHIVGDKLLTKIASVLDQYARDGDIAARMGGDEFAILFKTLSGKEEALSIAEGIERDVTEIGKSLGIDLATSASMGIAFVAGHRSDFDSLYSRADEAMYKAKKDGGGRIVVAKD